MSYINIGPCILTDLNFRYFAAILVVELFVKRAWANLETLQLMDVDFRHIETLFQ
jgi:hypothetical protein